MQYLARIKHSLLDFYARNTLRKEITWVIILKILALIILWKLFIAVPTVKPLQTTDVAEHFLIK